MANKTKRQDVPSRGQLQIVATPIGNLGDLSPRAREALARAGAVFCEDTRRTRELFTALALSTPELIRMDAEMEHRGLDALMDGILTRIERGENLVMVSDAGTPAVSDPGTRLVTRARAKGIEVVAVPGPSAITALLSISGCPWGRWGFHGFFPREKSERTRELEQIQSSWSEQESAVFWFESPHRIRQWVESCLEVFGDAQVDIVAGKELTKVHERVFNGALQEISKNILEHLEREGERGEWCVGIWPRPALAGESKLTRSPKKATISGDWETALKCLQRVEASASRAAEAVAAEFSCSKREVYERALELWGKKTKRGD